MELSNDWHKRTNVKLVDILSDILKELRPPKVPKPTHGYRIAEKAPEIVTAPGAYFPEKKGRVIPLESRQGGGTVTPTRTLQQMVERLASYTPSPLVPRQEGGEVDPNLFKETFSVNSGDPTQQGIEAAANTASIESTPINVSPLTPSLQSYAPGTNLTPTGPSTPLTGMAEYEASGRRMRGLPPETGTTNPVNPTNNRLNQITGFLRSFMKPPPKFRENRQSSKFGSDQRAAYDKKWKPYTDFMEGTQETPLFSRAPGGVISPDPLEGLSEEERANLLKLYGGHENVVDLAPNASGTFEAKTTPTSSPDNMTNVMTKISNAGETIVPKAEPVKQIEGGISGNLSEIKKDILPSGETRFTLPGTEGTATAESPAAYLKRVGGTEGAARADKIVSDRWAAEAASTPEGMELAERKKWATPGYRESQIAKAQKESDMASIKGGLPKSTVINVSPGYEKTYYEAHPEERFMDMAREENKPLMDTYTKMIEQNQNIIKGNFGDVTMGRKAKREARNAAIANLPHLEQALAQLQASNAAIPEKYFSSEAKLAAAEARAEKAGTPHLVQNARGGYDLIYPSKTPGEKAIISPTGVPGKMPAIATPGRKSEKTFDAKTGETYQQDFEWRDGTWESVGEKRVVGGPKPTDQGLKINKLNVIRKILDEDYANQIGADVNDVQKKLNPIQKEAYNRILAFAEKNAETMEPRAALDQALKDWYSTFGKKQRKPLSSFEGK